MEMHLKNNKAKKKNMSFGDFLLWDWGFQYDSLFQSQLVSERKQSFG